MNHNSMKQQPKNNSSLSTIGSPNQSLEKRTRLGLVHGEASIIMTNVDQDANTDSEASIFLTIVDHEANNISETCVKLTSVDPISTIESNTGVSFTNVDHDISNDGEVGVFWTNMDQDVTKFDGEASVKTNLDQNHIVASKTNIILTNVDHNTIQVDSKLGVSKKNMDQDTKQSKCDSEVSVAKSNADKNHLIVSETSFILTNVDHNFEIIDHATGVNSTNVDHCMLHAGDYEDPQTQEEYNKMFNIDESSEENEWIYPNDNIDILACDDKIMNETKLEKSLLVSKAFKDASNDNVSLSDRNVFLP